MLKKAGGYIAFRHETYKNSYSNNSVIAVYNGCCYLYHGDEKRR